MIKFPENTARFSWTRHIKNKMVFYNLSGAQILRIFSNPERREEGVAPKTIAAMKTMKHNVKTAATGAPQKKRETEVWIMYTVNTGKKTAHSKLEDAGFKKPKTSKITMISAWRYPGKTKVGERPKIPEGLLEELAEEGIL